MRHFLIRRLFALIVAIALGRILFWAFPALLNTRQVESGIVTVLIFISYQIACTNAVTMEGLKNGLRQFAIGMVANLGVTILAMSFLLPRLWAIALGDETFQTLLPNAETIPWLRIFAAAICVAVIEETGLRGYLQDFLRGIKIPIWLIVLIQGVVFAGPHTAYFTTGVVAIVYFALVGMLFSIAAFYYNNLYWCIGFHFFWDFVQIVCYGSRVSSTGRYLTEQTPNLFGGNYTQLTASIFAVSAIYFFAIRMQTKGLNTRNAPWKSSQTTH